MNKVDDLEFDDLEFNDLNYDELEHLIGSYSNYIIEFYDEHSSAEYPVSVYEFFDYEYKEILKEIKYGTTN